MNLIKETISLPSGYSITAESEEARNGLVLKAKEIISITDAEVQNWAGMVARDIRKHLKEVEEMRVGLTKPLLDGQRLLKSLADDYTLPLKGELARIERLATNFQEAELRRVAEEERKQREAFQQAERERIAAEQAAAKAAERVNTEKQLEKAISLESVAVAAEQKVQAILRAPLPEVQKAKGQTMKRYLRWEVTDLRALYAARPELCSIEPKASAIQSTCVPEMPVPGLKLWWENKASFTTR